MKDTIWQHFEVLDKTKHRFKCKYCGFEVTSKGSKRVRAHLGRVPGKGASLCDREKVPERVRVEARDTFRKDRQISSPGDTPPQKRQRTGSSDYRTSSNVQGQSRMWICGTSSAPGQHIANLTGSTSSSAPAMVETGSALQHKMEWLERKLSHIARRSARQGQLLGQVTSKREELSGKLNSIKTTSGITTGQGEIDDSLLLLETELDELATATDDLLTQQGMLSDLGEAFLLTDPVGMVSQDRINYACESLLRADVSRVVLSGMAGVGKTFLAKHIHNKLLRDKSFPNVFWVTVSKDTTVRDLQIKIARAASVGSISNLLDEKERAAHLRDQLTKKEKSVLILDDVWKHYELEKVGVPDDITLLLTTRSLGLCRKMQCQEQIAIECFQDEEEGVSLFKNHLRYNSSHPQVKDTIADVVSSCGGLPLAIVGTAKTIRGRFADADHNWPSDPNQLKCLIDAGLKEMYEMIFPILKASFDELSIQMQNCLLRCAVRGVYMDRSDLIELFIDEGLISRSTSRAVMIQKGYSILDGLIDASLLEHHDLQHVCIHKMIKRMTVDIMSRNSMLVVDDLKKIADAIYWPPNLQLIRIGSYDLAEDKDEDDDDLPDGFSPDVPELSTILMDYNIRLTRIPGPFFQHMPRLKVIVLSHSSIEELPNSFSDLLCLEALVLRQCRSLTHIPSLARLTSLSKLDLVDCEALEQLPDGLELLVNLEYLDFLGTGIRQFEVAVFQFMSKLRFLSMGEVEFQLPATTLQLEFLRCYFYNADQLKDSLNRIPSRYNLNIINPGTDLHDCEESFERIVQICGITGEVCLRGDFQQLTINSSKDFTVKLFDSEEDSGGEMVIGSEIDFNLGPSLGQERYSLLTEMNLVGCTSLKYVFSGASTIYLKHLRTLMVTGCAELESITDTGMQIPQGEALPSLETIQIFECHRMRTVFGDGLVPHLKKLRWINVDECNSMKALIEPNQPSVLQLEYLFLTGLPELSLILEGTMECENIVLQSCPKVKRIPLHLPKESDGRISMGRLKSIVVDSEGAWKSLVWPEGADDLLDMFATW